MLSFFEDVLNLEYQPGSYNDSQHEKVVELLLIKHQFKSIDRKVSQQERDTALKTNQLSGLNNQEYISQPCGKNNSPDFIVNYNNKLYFIECKSVNSGKSPVYNSGLPKDEYIYILSSNKYKETTFFYGKSVVTDKMRKLYDEYLSKIYKIERKLVIELEKLDKNNPLGISYYVRDMFCHKGKNMKTDYFRHKERKNFEKQVLDSVR